MSGAAYQYRTCAVAPDTSRRKASHSAASESLSRVSRNNIIIIHYTSIHTTLSMTYREPYSPKQRRYRFITTMFSPTSLRIFGAASRGTFGDFLLAMAGAFTLSQHKQYDTAQFP
jgi:hypothetical protein